MTATTVDETAATAGTPGVGRVARVIGPIVDIEFPADQIPELYNALQVDIDLFAHGGLKMLDRIHAIGYRVWDQRPTVTKVDGVALLLLSIARAVGRRMGVCGARSLSPVTPAEKVAT